MQFQLQVLILLSYELFIKCYITTQKLPKMLQNVAFGKYKVRSAQLPRPENGLHG